MHDNRPNTDAGKQATMGTLMLKQAEAARIAGVSVRTINRMCHNGELPAVRLRGAWRINRAAFLEQLGIAE